MDRFLSKAKHVTNNKWITGFVFKDMYGTYIQYVDSNVTGNRRSHKIPVNEFTLCQCTGLKDSEDNLIFEGDIIDNGYINPMDKKRVSLIRVVEHDGAGSFNLIDNESKCHGMMYEGTKGKILGNIHDKKSNH